MGQIDSTSGQKREVFARFGLAMYRAQVLERQLAFILMSKHIPDPTKSSEVGIDTIFERLFSLTLGQLVSEIASLTKLSEEEKEHLCKALAKRNWLTHHYFWERSVDLLTESGRDLMIEELQEAAYQFETLDDLFTSRWMKWAGAFGITDELLEKEVYQQVRDYENS